MWYLPQVRASTRAGTGQVYEGEDINTDVTCSGATIALGLTYFNTNNQSVYDWMSIPQSQYLLEGIRPDFLQLRVIIAIMCHSNKILF